MAAVEEEDCTQTQQYFTSSSEENDETTAEIQSVENKETAQEQSAAKTGQEKSEPSWKNNPKIKVLTDIAEEQKKQLKQLQDKLEEAREALAQEKVTTKQMDKKMQLQNQRMKNHKILNEHLKKELKEQKKSQEAMANQLKKERENQHAITEMFKSIQREGCKVNHALQQERRNRERKQAEYKELISGLNKENIGLHSEVTDLTIKLNDKKNEIDTLKSEKGKLGDKVFKQEMKIARLEVINGTMDARIGYLELSQKASAVAKKKMKIEIEDYKKNYMGTVKELKKAKEEKESFSAKLKKCKAKCQRGGKINKADKEMIADMKATINVLKQENDLLRCKLTSGFIGNYRKVKRFFGRIADAIRTPFY